MINLIEELDLKGIDDTLYEKFYTEKSVVYDDLVKYKGTNISGRVVHSEKDLAVLATIYRDDRWETLRVIYMNGDTVVGSNGVSSRLHQRSTPNLSGEDNKRLFIRHKVNMKNLGADSYFLMHNHPSKSNHKPSQSDMDLTLAFYQNLPGFRGHIITSNSGASFIDKDFNVKEITNNKKFSIESVTGDTIIDLSKEYKKDNKITLIYLNIDNEVVLIQTADDFELKNVDQFQDTIYNFRNKIGANAVYLVVYNDKQFNDATVYVSTIFKIITNLIYIDLNSGTYKAYNRHSFTSVDADPPKLHGAGKIKGYKNN